MKVILPDALVHHLVAKGVTVSTMAKARLCVEDPERSFTLTDGTIKFEGHGTIVLGTADRTGKFFKISQIRVAR